MGSYSLHTFRLAGKHKVTFQIPQVTEAEKWGLKTKGVRLFRLIDSLEQTIADVASTAELFVSEATKRVPRATAKVNAQFLNVCTPFTTKERTVGDVCRLSKAR
jgi:hypothetical protein